QASEGADLSVGELAKRVLLRFGASAVFGLATVLLATAWGSSLLTAGALGSVVACLGADLASGLYARWLAKKAGICDVPPTAPSRDG
ncbi:MAG: pyocin R2, holin, partial [Gammaproteobacteria bacterium]|nr:pyocin R2, holin [Gammaproteobacteria bacterium]